MSHFNSKNLIKKDNFHRLTGVKADVFVEMVRKLTPFWEKRLLKKKLSGRPFGVGGLEDHLLVLLIIYRCHITQDFLGLIFGVNKTCICRTLQRIEPIAKKILGVKRSIKVTKSEAEALLIDATEQAVERPKKGQKVYYSGKKKQHTIKVEVITTESGKIVSVSNSEPGAVHDVMIRRKGTSLPPDARVYADSGYQGYQNDHKNLEIPYKSSKNKPLTEDEKEYNHALSSFRVRVEHTIGKIKNFKILSERYRYAKKTHSTKMAVVAGIVNLIAGF
jgi:hypothetical protein